MRNLTVAVSDEGYRRARQWTAQRDTSISAVVRYLLETLPRARATAVGSHAGAGHVGEESDPVLNEISMDFSPAAPTPGPERPE